MQFFTEHQRKFNSIKNSVHENDWIKPSIPIHLTKFCLTISLGLDILYLPPKMRKLPLNLFHSSKFSRKCLYSICLYYKVTPPPPSFQRINYEKNLLLYIQIRKVKLSHSMPWGHIRGAEVYLHSLLPSATDTDEWSISHPGRFTLVPIEYESVSAPELDWKILE